jgi:hypothetical protein
MKRLLRLGSVVAVLLAGGIGMASPAAADPPRTGGVQVDPGSPEGIREDPVAMFYDTGDTTTPPVSDFTATITWNDGVIQAGIITVAAPGSEPAGLFHVIHPPRLFEEGQYSATILITDIDEGTSFTYTDLVFGEITDAPLDSVGRAVEATAGNPFTATVGSFSDAPIGDAVSPVSDFSATIDWGDSSSTSAGTVVTTSANNFSVTGTHSYANPGCFTITTTINDVGGSTTMTTGSATVSTGSGPPVCATATTTTTIVGQKPAAAAQPIAAAPSFTG